MLKKYKFMKNILIEETTDMIQSSPKINTTSKKFTYSFPLKTNSPASYIQSLISIKKKKN